MSYTMDGEYLLAGGKSKYICIYNIQEEMLVKRFEISQNKSFDGIDVSYSGCSPIQDTLNKLSRKSLEEQLGQTIKIFFFYLF